jgi:hypothetical protein
MALQINQTDKNLIILDIDGCLVNSEHRLQHLLDGDRETYNRLHPQDTAIPAGRYIYTLLKSFGHCDLLFVTGRQEDAREFTLAQLSAALGSEVEDWQLLMRPVGDDRHDTILKPWLIEEAGWSLDKILMAIDDRDSIVQMWRDRGVTCWQTQPGSF